MKRKTALVSLLHAIGSGIAERVYAKTATFQARRKVILQESPLAGFQYHRAPAIWPFLRVGEQLNLRREPSNPHDHYAIAVWFKNEHLGYIPRRENRTIAKLLDRGEMLETRIVRLLEEENPWRKIRFRVEMVH
ncbi:MAG: HIRAN domain-containing protein [Candidatus Thiodiazotropha sp. (ex. Lucinoma kazani)]|nr:HIRAN domain-containing protein [Candidatus Thiodiazotropha sp. (ex Lucinoma borealis)]